MVPYCAWRTARQRQTSRHISTECEKSSAAINTVGPGDGPGCNQKDSWLRDPLSVGNKTILLDSGYKRANAISNTDGLVWISHSHQDHSEGWTTASNPPLALMSEGTARILHAMRQVDNRRLASRIQVLSLNPNSGWHSLGPDVRLRPFAVPHSPGAAGLEIQLGDKNLIYTSDVCLRTGRLDFVPRLMRRIKAGRRDQNFLLLDGTMAGRKFGAGQADVPATLLRAVSLAGATDIVISAPRADHLLYAHLDLFRYISANDEHRNRWWFLMPEEDARPMFQVLHYRWSKVRSGQSSAAARRFDPFLFAQYGGTLSAWAESSRLLWVRDGWEQPRPGEGRIWYVTPKSLPLADPRSSMVWAHVPWGHRTEKIFAEYRTEEKIAEWGQYRTDVDTSLWTMHTSAESLADAVRKLSERAQVILFHQSPDLIEQFINSYDLTAQALTKESTQL